MEDNLVGYVLNSLDPATQAQVEAYLKTTPEARVHVERLRQAIAPLEADRDNALPPPDLVIRTLGRVAESICKHLPRSPRPTSKPAPVLRSWWRRADVLIAACLLLTVLGLGVPAISQLRNHQAKIECQNNLRQFFVALQAYHDQHGNLPNFASGANNKAVGLIAPVLHDAGVLPPQVSVRCPADGSPVPVTNLSVDEIQNLSPEEFAMHAPRLLPSYGYSLGYQDKDGFHFPNRPQGAISSLEPLMADRPPLGATGNSFNHGGLGQNVLYHDGHVTFATVRTVGINGDDIYLNREMKLAPGIGKLDTVIGPSASTFGASAAQP